MSLGPGMDQAARRRLTARILIGMAAGVAFGLLLNWLGAPGRVEEFLVEGVFHLGGAVFMRVLTLLIVPLVFVSLVCGTAGLDDVARLGRIGGKTLLLYLATTAVAVSLALAAALLVRPGDGFDLGRDDVEMEVPDAPPLVETLIDLFPSNPVEAMAEGNMLQIIVFAILFGLACTLVGTPGRRLLRAFEDLNAVILRLVMMLMQTAPYGVFCLVARVFAEQGLDAIVPLASYFGLVIAVLVLHAVVTYPLLLRVLGRLDPITFYRKMRDPLAVAFSTSSSNATLPVTLENAELRLGVHNSVASFTVPLGATINMDGTAIMQGVATGFIAQAYGIDLGVSGYLTVVLMATLASIGTAGVPSAGIVMLTMVLRQVNLPASGEGIALVFGVDRLLDMVRTAVNVTGDSAVSCIVARSEGRLSKEVFRSSGD